MNTKILLVFVLLNLAPSTISSSSRQLTNSMQNDNSVSKSAFARNELAAVATPTTNTTKKPENGTDDRGNDQDHDHQEEENMYAMILKLHGHPKKNLKGFLYRALLSINFLSLLFMIGCGAHFILPNLRVAIRNESQIIMCLTDLPAEKQSLLNGLNQNCADPYGWTNWQEA